jgi:Domain of unknown function (DUF4126)
MLDHWLVDGVSTAALAVALAACAGLRAWLPLLLAGALSRAGVLELGESFRILGSNKALALFALATVIEVLGDKIPMVDHALDLLSTFLRPAAGAVLAASVFGRILDPVQSVALGVAVGAPSALVPHAGKAALRAASSSFTAGLANPMLSLLEDGITLVLFTLAVVVPVLVALGLLAVVVVLLRRIRPRGLTPAASR